MKGTILGWKKIYEWIELFTKTNLIFLVLVERHKVLHCQVWRPYRFRNRRYKGFCFVIRLHIIT